MYAPDETSRVYGRGDTRLSPTLAAFVNGVAVSVGVRVAQDRRGQRESISDCNTSVAKGFYPFGRLTPWTLMTLGTLPLTLLELSFQLC